MIVVGLVLALVMVVEYFWLYAPFGSGSGSVTTSSVAAAPGADSTGADSTSGSGPDATPTSTDAGPGASSSTTYATIGNVVIRATPARTGAVLGKVPKGTRLSVTCVAVGEPVRGATTADAHWDKVTYDAVTGYVSNTLVATGPAVDDPAQIPPC